VGNASETELSNAACSARFAPATSCAHPVVPRAYIASVGRIRTPSSDAPFSS